ncbi:MAG: AtpZ/AtpI family protein [Flavobacteriia bacterium]|nr:AtpZ/AtpI family protein [Flavobacteriia bacterium]
MPNLKDKGPSFITYSSLGFQMLGFMAIFGFIGYKADKYFGFDTPILLALGLVFGVVGSIVVLIRTLQKNNKE